MAAPNKPAPWSFAAVVRSGLRDPDLRVLPGEGARELAISSTLQASIPETRRHSGAIVMPVRAEALTGTAIGTFRPDGTLANTLTTVESVIRPETCLARLGARRTNLGEGYGGKRSVSPSRVTAQWVDPMLGEATVSREISFGSSSASPRECSVVIDVTRKFLREATEAEAMLQDVMSEASESETERVQIAGSGNGIEPLGILTAANAGAIATAAGAITYAKLLEVLQERLDAGARLRRCGFLLSQADFEDVAALERTGGHPALIEGPDGSWTLAGRPVEFSPWVPSGHAIVGEFAQVELVYMGLPQLLVNPYTRAQQQVSQISVFDTFDTSISRPSLLAVIEP